MFTVHHIDEHVSLTSMIISLTNTKQSLFFIACTCDMSNKVFWIFIYCFFFFYLD